MPAVIPEEGQLLPTSRSNSGRRSMWEKVVETISNSGRSVLSEESGPPSKVLFSAERNDDACDDTVEVSTYSLGGLTFASSLQDDHHPQPKQLSPPGSRRRKESERVLLERVLPTIDADTLHLIRLLTCLKLDQWDSAIMNALTCHDQHCQEQLFATGLVVAVSSSTSTSSSNEDASSLEYSFAKPVYKHAIYQQIPQPTKCHYKVAMKLWENLDEVDKYGALLVQQLVLGKDHLAQAGTAQQLAAKDLCWHLAQDPIQRRDYAQAIQYVRGALRVLGWSQNLSSTNATVWEQHYDTILPLHNALAELLYCHHEHELVRVHVQEVLEFATKSQLDTVQARSTLVYLQTSVGDKAHAIQGALESLALLGETSLSENPSRPRVDSAEKRLNGILRGMSPQQVMRLPRMTDEWQLAKMKLLNICSLAAAHVNPLLARDICCTMVRLTLDHGLCEVSSVGFALFGVGLCTAGKHVADGVKCGRLALALYDAFAVKQYLGRVYSLYWGCISPWKERLEESLPKLVIARDFCLAEGEMESGLLSGCLAVWNNRDRASLGVLEADLIKLSLTLKEHGQTEAIAVLRPFWQSLVQLQGKTAARGDWNAGDTALEIEHNPGLRPWYDCERMIQAYHMRDFVLAEKLANESSGCLYKNSYGLICSATALFYECLALLALTKKQHVRHLRKVRKLTDLLHSWAKIVPWNLACRDHLVQAELARVMGQNEEAISLYQHAIVCARDFLVIEALANERLAALFIQIKEREDAIACLRQAISLYEKQESHVKVEMLQADLKSLVYK